MSVKETKSVKYVLVAPDGGWGYMICVGVVLNWVTIAFFFGVYARKSSTSDLLAILFHWP